MRASAVTAVAVDRALLESSPVQWVPVRLVWQAASRSAFAVSKAALSRDRHSSLPPSSMVCLALFPAGCGNERLQLRHQLLEQNQRNLLRAVAPDRKSTRLNSSHVS